MEKPTFKGGKLSMVTGTVLFLYTTIIQDS